MFGYTSFFKVVVVKIDVLESLIIDERHFSSDTEAQKFARSMNEAGYATILAAIR